MSARSFLPCLLILGSMTAWSADVNLPLTDDSTVTGNRASSNYGTNTGITIHDFGPKQGLVRFDASGVTGETVQNATLSLFLNGIRDSGLITIHPITSSWDEGSVTWNSLPTFEATAVGSASVSSSEVGSVVSFDVTDTAQRWANGLLENHGFLIMTNDVVRAIFDSKEKSGGTPPSLNVVTDDVPPPPTSGIGTLPITLDLSNPPIVIDEPGHYILDRDWLMTDNGFAGVLIDVQVKATIDMQGFEIDDRDSTARNTIKFGSDGGTVMNGRIIAAFDGSGISSAGTATVARMFVSVYGDDTGAGVDLGGWGSKIFDSVIIGPVGLSGDHSSITSSTVDGLEGALYISSNNNTIAGNTLSAYACCEFGNISGDDNTFSHNTIRHGENAVWGLIVDGNQNLIFSNSFAPINSLSLPSAHIRVNGSGNVVKDNISLLSSAPVIPVGISFSQDGNFYQNNVMNAVVPFELNGTTQTDLGGNVGY